MPNGDPNFDFAKLEAFFAPLARDITAFAQQHHLKIVKYYHDVPGWSLHFAHPEGGEAYVEVRKAGDDAVCLLQAWWIDDYDAATRSAKYSAGDQLSISKLDLPHALREWLQQILCWKKGDWTQVARGFERIWHRYSRAEFEALSRTSPELHWPDTAS